MPGGPGRGREGQGHSGGPQQELQDRIPAKVTAASTSTLLKKTPKGKHSAFGTVFTRAEFSHVPVAHEVVSRLTASTDTKGRAN